MWLSGSVSGGVLVIWEMWSALLVTRNPWCESMLGAVDDDGVA